MTSQHTPRSHAAIDPSPPPHAATDHAGDPLPDSDEVEWQFDAPDLGRVANWLRSRPAEADPQVEAGPVVEQADGYFDTADWRIYRAGFTLRLRRRADRPSEATLKALSSSTTGVTTRREINEPIDAAPQSDGVTLGRLLHAAPGPVGAWLRGAGDAATLGLLFTVHTRRTLFFLRDHEGLAGEVALDETHVEVREQDVGALRRVEIEARGPMSALDALVRSLTADCDLSPARGSKFEFGLAAAGLGPDIAPDEDQPG